MGTQGTQLSALDAAFLELEEADESAHMHIGWAMVFEPPPGGGAPRCRSCASAPASGWRRCRASAAASPRRGSGRCRCRNGSRTPSSTSPT